MKIDATHNYKRLVKNKRLIISLPLLLAASVLLPLHVPSAHAVGTGLVCVTSSTSATSCPAGPANISPIAPGSTFTVGVFVQGSDPMGGFDIFVQSDPSFATPVSAALAGLIVTPTLTSICINGFAQTGSCTLGAANGVGVVEVNTIESSGNNECANTAPCSGMAFTITYKMQSSSSGTQLSYPAAGGCSTTSVASPANICVLVSDNTGSPLSENIQGATVSSAIPGDFDLSPATSSFRVGPGLFNTTVLTVTSTGGFTGSVTFSTGAVPSGVTVMFVPSSATVTTVGGSATTTVVVFVAANVAQQMFTITVTGSDAAAQHHQVSVSVTVVGAPPTVTRVNWNHELSLSLDGPQIWHIFVTNPEVTDIRAVFEITGRSTTNPANTFDITCGKTCVNTARDGVNHTSGLTPILISALSTPKQIKISYTLSSAFSGEEVKFTVTLYITTATGSFYQSTNAFSGTFFVFP